MAFHSYITSPSIYQKALRVKSQAVRKLFGGRNWGNLVYYNSLYLSDAMLFFFLASPLFNKELLQQTFLFSHTPHAPYLCYQMLWLSTCSALHEVSSVKFRRTQVPKEISALQLQRGTSGSPCDVQLAEDDEAQVSTLGSAAAFWQQRTKAQPHFRARGGRASVLRSSRPVLSRPLSKAGFFTLCLSLAESLLILVLLPVSALPQRTWLPPKPLHFLQVRHSFAIVLLLPLHPSLSAFSPRSLPQTASTSLPRGSLCPPLNLHSAYSFGLWKEKSRSVLLGRFFWEPFLG